MSVSIAVIYHIKWTPQMPYMFLYVT